MLRRRLSTAVELGRISELTNAPCEAVLLKASTNRSKVDVVGAVFAFTDDAQLERSPTGQRLQQAQISAARVAAQAVGPAVVPVIAEYSNTEHSFGTGVVVEHLLITAEHVVEARVDAYNRTLSLPLRRLFIGKGGSPFVSPKVPDDAATGRYIPCPPEAVVFRAGMGNFGLHGSTERLHRVDIAAIDLRATGALSDAWPRRLRADSLQLSDAGCDPSGHVAIIGYPSRAGMSEINYAEKKRYMNLGVPGKALPLRELERLFGFYASRVLSAGEFGLMSAKPGAAQVADAGVDAAPAADDESFGRVNLHGTNAWPHVAPMLPGMSGSPVVTADGRVTAIHSSRSRLEDAGCAYNVAVPLSHPSVSAALMKLLQL